METIETIDQNTRRPITWNVDAVTDAGPQVTSRYGWTHSLAISKPKGRRVYVIWAVIEDNVVIRHSSPKVMF